MAELVDAEEEAAGGGEFGVGPDVGLSIEETGGVDEGPAFGEGDFPAHFMAGGGAVVGPAQEGVVLRLGDGQG